MDGAVQFEGVGQAVGKAVGLKELKVRLGQDGVGEVWEEESYCQ